ncbi:type II secretion system protein GspM [Paraglaciecola sp. 2405UD69-4]|uniref:type II secretion system protein GspM n=1 Tax=Paraglaciecola sp. 2405UD69-4 TaxID=3391836 RepID=UPI0039C9FA66
MSNAFKVEYQKLSDKLDKISTRERLLILFCGLVITIFLCFTLLISPIQLETQDTKERIKSTKSTIGKQGSELAAITVKLRNDPNTDINAKIEALRQDIESINAQIAEQTKHLVPASKMARLLENVLAETKNLKLIELKSLDPILVLVDSNIESNEKNEAIYRHGVTLTFEGSYFDIQTYLEKLEGLDWKFHWKKFDYKVAEYPKASVELEMYTLSTNKAFIGV